MRIEKKYLQLLWCLSSLPSDRLQVLAMHTILREIVHQPAPTIALDIHALSCDCVFLILLFILSRSRVGGTWRTHDFLLKISSVQNPFVISPTIINQGAVHRLHILRIAPRGAKSCAASSPTSLYVGTSNNDYTMLHIATYNII